MQLLHRPQTLEERREPRRGGVLESPVVAPEEEAAAHLGRGGDHGEEHPVEVEVAEVTGDLWGKYFVFFKRLFYTFLHYFRHFPDGNNTKFVRNFYPPAYSVLIRTTNYFSFGNTHSP